MKYPLAILCAFAIALSLLIGCSVGVAFALRWLIPDVEIGSALIVGVISTLGTLHLFLRFIGVLVSATAREAFDEEDDTVMMMMPPGLWRRQNRKKKKRER